MKQVSYQKWDLHFCCMDYESRHVSVIQHKNANGKIYSAIEGFFHTQFSSANAPRLLAFGHGARAALRIVWYHSKLDYNCY